MTRKEGACTASDCDYWLVSSAATRLANQACTLSARHIKNGTLRIQFNREVAYYARGIVREVGEGRKAPQQGLQALKEEQNSLLSQSKKVAQKGIGVIAGAFQFGTGASICYVSVGTLCAVVGAPMMAHGANNVYENGRNLLEGRSDVQGPVRKGYQVLAKKLGRGEAEGNIAYGAMDLAMSAYGIGRKVLKPDAWRLFRYVSADYVRAYKQAGYKALAAEAMGDVFTGYSIYKESETEDD